MGIKKCGEMAEELADWDMLQKLPAELRGFKLVRQFTQEGQELTLVTYRNEQHRALKVVYTEETGDLVCVKECGLNSYRDDSLYARVPERFAGEFLKKLDGLLLELCDGKGKYSWTARELGLDKWSGWQELPVEIGSFRRYVTPDNPLPYINGSVIFLDYSDFEGKNQFLLYYNEYRNEIFAEMKQKGLMLYSSRYDINFDYGEFAGKPGQGMKKLEQLLTELPALLTALGSGESVEEWQK